jgi:hypothetical protein
MNQQRWAAILFCAGIASAAAQGRGDYRLEVDSFRPPGSEDSALQGYVLLRANASNSRAVGSVGRAYSTSGQPGNTVWGVVTEAINFPGARGHIVGLESGVANESHDNVGELRGIDVVLKNRSDDDIGQPVAMVGENRYNESSSAVYISAQPRSAAGEYLGWQTGIKFGPVSVDRSRSRPYAAAIDMSQVDVPVPFYLLVWRCGDVNCGLLPGPNGLVLVRDIDDVVPGTANAFER